MTLHNQHVYEFYRWEAWVARELFRHFRAEILYAWAHEELAAQTFQLPKWGEPDGQERRGAVSNGCDIGAGYNSRDAAHGV